MRHVAISLVLACSGCSSCRAGEHDRAVVDSASTASAPPAAPPPSASPAPSSAAAVDASAPPEDAPWALVAKGRTSQLWIADVGPRVILGSRGPRGWADGSGPLVAAPKIDPEPDYTSAAGGTYPSAVFIATDKRIYTLDGDRFRDVAPIPPRMRAMVTYGDRGVVTVASVIEGSSMPTILPEERPATTLKPILAPGEAPPSFDLDPAFGAFEAAGTRDGHLWLLGFRAGKPGMWLAHVRPGQKTGYQLHPGSEKCDDAGFGIYVYRSRVVATSGSHAFLFVVNDAAECMGPIGTYLYDRSDKGFGGLALPKNAMESMGTHVVGATRDGTLYFATLDEVVHRRTPDGKTTRVALPKGCSAAQIVVKDDGDAWLAAHCEGHDGIYRRGRPQEPVAL